MEISFRNFEQTIFFCGNSVELIIWISANHEIFKVEVINYRQWSSTSSSLIVLDELSTTT